MRSQRLEQALVFVASFLGLFALQSHIRNSSPDLLKDRFYFQMWPSDYLMQTIEIKFMHEFGIQSLWYLHIQPPLFDFIRFVLSLDPLSKIGFVSGVKFDQRMYFFYIILYACFSVLVYVWCQSLGLNRILALGVTVLWATYPGNLAMATLLDSTYLSALLIAVFLFTAQETLRLREEKFFYAFLLFFVLATYTRTVFQIQLMVLVPVVVFYLLTRLPERNRRLVLAAIFGTVFIFALPIKQYILFGTTSTTTFAGQHKIEGIWHYPTEYELSQISIDERHLENARKYENKFNYVGQVAQNNKYEELFRKIVVEEPDVVIAGIKKSSLQGFERLNIPTQNYWANALVDFIPWSETFAKIAIGKNYLAMGVTVLLLYLLRFALRKNLLTKQGTFVYWPIGFWLIAIFLTVLIGSNRYEWTEVERLKFLIELPVLIYLVGALNLLLNFRQKETPPKSFELDMLA